MTYKILGITGPARCGKDTAADFIIKKRPAYIKTSFADPIKAMLRVGFELHDDQLYGNHKEMVDKRYGVSPRHMMQTLGTEWGRTHVDNNIWVNAVMTHMESFEGTFILPDVRFENEAAFVREHGILLHIEGRANNIKTTDHASENGVDVNNSDRIIFNGDGVREFHDKVLLVLQSIESNW